MASQAAAAAAYDSGLAWPSEPMLAKPTDHLPAARVMPGGCLYEPKWDGYRGLIGVDAAGLVQIRSRRGTDLTYAFPDIATAVGAQLPPGTLLDGELVVWNDGHLDFAQLQRRMAGPSRVGALARKAPASYVAFDVLQLAGRDLATEPLRVRRRRPEALLPGLSPPLQITPATRDFDTARQWLSDYAAAGVGIEGLVIKGLGARYQPGRRGWLKLRTRASAEAVVGAVTGTLTKPERLILGLPSPDGSLVVAGSTVSLKPDQQREIAAFVGAAEADHPWPAELPSGRLGVWVTQRKLPVVLVEPTLIVEVDADAAYEHGHWRHLTRLIRVRPDLSADEIEPWGSDPSLDR